MFSSRAHLTIFLREGIPSPNVNFIVHYPMKDSIVSRLIGQGNCSLESIISHLVER